MSFLRDIFRKKRVNSGIKLAVRCVTVDRRIASECVACDRYWAPWIWGPAIGEPCTNCGKETTALIMKGLDNDSLVH
jgi:hypothetical protein